MEQRGHRHPFVHSNYCIPAEPVLGRGQRESPQNGLCPNSHKKFQPVGVSTEPRDSIVDVLDLSFYSETIPGIREPWSIQGGGEQIPPEEKTSFSKDLIWWLRIYCFLEQIPLENWVGSFVNVCRYGHGETSSIFTHPTYTQFLLTCGNRSLAIWFTDKSSSNCVILSNDRRTQENLLTR